MDRDPVEAQVLQGTSVSLILFVIYTSGVIKLLEEYLSPAEGLSNVDNLGLALIGSNINKVNTIPERYVAK